MIRDDGQVICTAPLQMNKTTKLQTTFTPNKEGSYLRESIIIIFFCIHNKKGVYLRWMPKRGEHRAHVERGQ